MTLIPELKRRARHVVGPLIGSLLVVYFAYHAVEGDRGIRAWQRLDGEINEAQAVRDRLSDQQAAFEKRVAMLRPESLDADLLEERARLVLGFVPANGLIMGDSTLPTTRLAGLGSVRRTISAN
jgi:cell division protein FtsB